MTFFRAVRQVQGSLLSTQVYSSQRLNERDLAVAHHAVHVQLGEVHHIWEHYGEFLGMQVSSRGSLKEVFL